MRRGHEAHDAVQAHASEKPAISEVIYGTITILAVILALERYASSPWEVTFGVVGTTQILQGITGQSLYPDVDPTFNAD